MKPNSNLTSAVQVILVDDNHEEYALAKILFKEQAPEIKLGWFKDPDLCLNHLLELTQSGTNGLVYVLIDVNMPGKDGRQVLREMDENKLLDKVSVVMTTSCKFKRDEELFAQFPGVKFIEKPCGLSEYSEFIRSFKNN